MLAHTHNASRIAGCHDMELTHGKGETLLDLCLCPAGCCRWRNRMRLTWRRLPTGCKRTETCPHKRSNRAQSGEKQGN
eukprot:1140640-Pelagomonas_calceolata.AAC.8